MRVYWLIVAVLAVWRVTHLLVAEDGPWNSLARFRRLAGDGFFASLLDCFYCLSLWTAAPVAWFISHGVREWLLLWFAISGGAILLERATDRAPSTPSPIYYEEPEDNDGMLRQDQTSNAG